MTRAKVLRNPWLTAGMERALRDMAEQDEDLVYAKGQCWIGLRRTSPKVLNDLLRLCLVSSHSVASATLERYDLNEDGKRTLADIEHVPLFVQQMRGEKHA